MAKLLKIAKTEDVVPGQAAAFTIEGKKIALFNVEGTYYAIGDTCTHRGGPLSEGDVQGVKVTCPWHGANFDLRTGAVMGPPAQNGVPSYKVVVEGADIKVEVKNQRSRRTNVCLGYPRGNDDRHALKRVGWEKRDPRSRRRCLSAKLKDFY